MWSVMQGGNRARQTVSPGTNAGRGHVHWFRRLGDDPFSSAVLYRCRCGQVSPGA